jgi:hypothetical protein
VERPEEGSIYGVQRPVYYLSEVLSSWKQWYPHFQNLAYIVYMIARKVRDYFQVPPITVVSKAPLSDILNNYNATRRVAKWRIELVPHDWWCVVDHTLLGTPRGRYDAT